MRALLILGMISLATACQRTPNSSRLTICRMRRDNEVLP
jgi:hypothetical protein